MWWAPFTLKSHYVIYLDSWRELCSRAPGPQDPLKALYIAATIDRRFYRVLYKYVNRRYLIGFCGYMSVPQRKQSCENYLENTSLHSKWVWEIEMFWRLTAGQGGDALHPFQGKLPALGKILSFPRKWAFPLTEFLCSVAVFLLVAVNLHSSPYFSKSLTRYGANGNCSQVSCAF